MTSTESTAERATSPYWIRHPQILTWVPLTLVMLASVVEIVRVALVAGPILTYVAVGVGVFGALLVRRLAWPGLVLGAVSPIIAGLGGWDPLVEFSVAVFILFAFSLRGRAVVVATIFVAVLTYVGIVEQWHHFLNIEAVAAVAASIAAGALASAVRAQQQYWIALEQRAADAIANRENEANRRVTQERLRIARDLHDVVGHQVAVLGVQLGAIEVSSGKPTEESRVSFAAARSTVKAILQETQQILSVLRNDGDNRAGSLPAPGFRDLPALIDSFKQIGLNIDSRIVETPIGIDPGVDLTVYRVIQEGLTNAHRYGDGHARVRVALGNGRLHIDITNPLDQKAHLRESSGFGLVGMRERVTSAGGTLELRPDGRDFIVHVVLEVSGAKVS